MTASFAIAIACVMLAATAGIWLTMRYAAQRQVEQLLVENRAQIAREWNDEPHQRSDLSDFVREQNEDLRQAGVTLFAVDADNRVIARPEGILPSWPPQNDAWRFVTLPAGNVTFVLALPWKGIEHRNREIALILLAISLLVVVASSIGAWILVGRTLSPIDRLAVQAHAATVEDLNVHLEAPSDDSEITRLVSTLNALLERQARAAATQGRFYAAASHELRTPLQALQGHLELALHRPRGAEQYRETIIEAEAQTRRLTVLVQDLLFLNQLEMATSKAPPQDVDLADLCERLLSAQRAAIAEKSLVVETALPDAARLLAPWNHLEVLLRNLFENAVKYCPDGGKIAVQCADDGSRLELFNQCGAMPSQHLQRLFEPFYRPDSSRNSQTGGNGLGLAICKAICDVNGWQIELKPEADGLNVRVDFSCATQTPT